MIKRYLRQPFLAIDCEIRVFANERLLVRLTLRRDLNYQLTADWNRLWPYA
jgi:hypothetical protein